MKGSCLPGHIYRTPHLRFHDWAERPDLAVRDGSQNAVPGAGRVKAASAPAGLGLEATGPAWPRQTEKHICAFAALQNSAQQAGRGPDAGQPTRQNADMNRLFGQFRVGFLALIMLTLWAGAAHAQVCGFNYPNAQAVPTTNRPAMPVPTTTRVAQQVPDSGCTATTWVTATVPAGSYSWEGVTYGNGKFVVVGDNGAVTTSTDGISWTTIITVSTINFEDVDFGQGLFVAVGSGPAARIARSVDGVSWTTMTPPVSAGWNMVAYGNGTFLVTAGTNYLTSPDGVSWTARTVSNSLSYIAYGGGRFVGTNDSGVASVSVDGGVTFVTSSIPTNLRVPVYGKGLFALINAAGLKVTTLDGLTWQSYSTAGGNNYTGTAFGQGLFVGARINQDAGGRIAKSTNGINWTNPTTTVFMRPLADVTFGGGRFVAVAYLGHIYYSTD
jgi:hypothetical protein